MNLYISVKNLNKSLWFFSTEVKRMVMERREREREREEANGVLSFRYTILCTRGGSRGDGPVEN